MAKWAATGREVHLLILTNGDRGSGDPTASREQLAATRRRETEAAVEVLGLASARVLSTHDGELENTSILREAVTRRIREVRAETVVSCDPTAVFFENRYYNHSDHRKRQSSFLQRAARRRAQDPGRVRRVAGMVERAEPHGGRDRVLRRQDPGARSTREPAHRGDPAL